MKTLLVSLGIEYTYGRTLLAGIVEEARRHVDVRVRLARTKEELSGLLASGEHFHAILGMVWDAADAQALRQRVGRLVSFAHVGAPVADLHVVLDDRAIGAMAAEELNALGHARLAVFQPENHWFCLERTVGFLEEASGQGRVAAVLRSRADFDRWLDEESGNGGVMAANDVVALELAQHCAKRGIGVPNPVSILGVDDDEVYVHLGARLLSSIRLPFREMGAEAVRRALLEEDASAAQVLLKPVGVVHRETTATAGAYPPLVRAFLDRIRRERPLPPSVGEACKRWKLPRRSLEIACREHAGHTPGQFLRDERRRLAEQLEADGFSVGEVAYEVGYAQARSLGRLMEE